ncbi:hypothetical protein BU17DRAFT_67021 [Hysterangium stoloniferum]|nr:hypothetical protein BU17DRAFT_67021 [Hysterangium stoloniferum]
MPIFGIQEQLQQILEQQEQQQQQTQLLNLQLQQQTQLLEQLSEQITKLQNSDRQNLLPVRLQNTTASFTAPLMYPQGVVLPTGAPATKRDLVALDAPSCEAVAQALGLPPLLPGATIAAQRQQIVDHLGGGLTVFMAISWWWKERWWFWYQLLDSVVITVTELQNMLPLRLHNSTASYNAPLTYPPGVAFPKKHPTIKRDLVMFTVHLQDGRLCVAVVQQLGRREEVEAQGLAPLPAIKELWDLDYSIEILDTDQWLLGNATPGGYISVAVSVVATAGFVVVAAWGAGKRRKPKGLRHRFA